MLAASRVRQRNVAPRGPRTGRPSPAGRAASGDVAHPGGIGEAPANGGIGNPCAPSPATVTQGGGARGLKPHVDAGRAGASRLVEELGEHGTERRLVPAGQRIGGADAEVDGQGHGGASVGSVWIGTGPRRHVVPAERWGVVVRRPRRNAGSASAQSGSGAATRSPPASRETRNASTPFTGRGSAVGPFALPAPAPLAGHSSRELGGLPVTGVRRRVRGLGSRLGGRRLLGAAGVERGEPRHRPGERGRVRRGA